MFQLMKIYKLLTKKNTFFRKNFQNVILGYFKRIIFRKNQLDGEFMVKFKLALGVLGFGLLAASCSDNITNNYYETPDEPRVDTLVVLDTVFKIDTIYRIDTLVLSQKDTIHSIDTLAGLNGLSAYEVAVKNGYKGTEEEWVKNTSFGYVKDDRDEQTYKTVRIGNQVWMAENMNYRIPDGGDGIYTWSEAKSDACFDGWHLPSEGEWNTLFDYIGGTSVAGVLLRSTDEWRVIEEKEDSYTKRFKGVDAYGFNVKPIDERNTNNTVMSVTLKSTKYWTGTSASEGGDGKIVVFSGDRDAVTVSAGDATDTYAVRCLKDSE